MGLYFHINYFVLVISSLNQCTMSFSVSGATWLPFILAECTEREITDESLIALLLGQRMI